MTPVGGRRVRAMLAATVVAASLGGAILAAAVPSAAAGAASAASAAGPAAAAVPTGAPTTTVTLYVDASAGTQATGCTAPGTAACATIQEGVSAAEKLAGEAVVVTVAAGTYAGGVMVTAGDLVSLTLQGAGGPRTIVTGGTTVRDVTILSGTVTLRGLVVDSGRAIYGGGVSDGSDQPVANLPSRGLAPTRTGMFSAANDPAAATRLPSPAAGGPLTLVDDTFSGDEAAAGGAVYFAAVSGTAGLTAIDDTFSNDTASTAGGAVFVAPGGFTGPETPAAFADDTLTGDAAPYGGGILSLRLTELAFDTFANDTATVTGGGVLMFRPAIVLNSIFDASSCARFSEAPLEGAYNAVTPGTTCPNTSGTGVTATTLGLSATLGVNTAPAAPETLALTPTSPAIGEVPAGQCIGTVSGVPVTTDERGVPRQSSPTAACDAGAYEYVARPPVGPPPVTTRRVSGTTADATAAAALATAFPGTCPGTTGDRPVVLASDEEYADALASAYLAKDLSTGTLLTPATTLSAATLAALRTEGITHVYVVGGPLAVSTAVVAALEATPAYTCEGTKPLGRNLQVTRIAGATAPATAAQVAAFPGKGFVGSADLSGVYGTAAAGVGSSPSPSAPGALRTAIVASDGEFQDAEAAAVLSYAQDLPILLTHRGPSPRRPRAPSPRWASSR